jgi:membrane protein YqaA with SNARE-associated domain
MRQHWDHRHHRISLRDVTSLRELLQLLQHGLPLDQMTTAGSAISAAAALGFLFGAIPVGAAELLAVGAGAVRPRTLVVPLVVALTAGHVAGKLVWYWIGTLETRVTQPRLRAWIEQAQAFRRQNPQLGTGLLASSALASVPPFHLMVVASGIGRIPLATVAITSFAMRLLRFGLIAAFPAALQALF